VKDMVDAIYKLMHSDIESSVNIGPSDDISVNGLVDVISKISRKEIRINHIEGPVGVQSRNFSNEKILSLGWEPKYSLRQGMEETYDWLEKKVR